MSWYRIIFKQLQPLHMGYQKYGVISQTRIFITGQMMWGALTNAYRKMKESDKDRHKKENDPEENDYFANISCFYPYINKIEMLPTYKEGEFYLNDTSEIEFRQKYVTTFLSTATNASTRSSKDESLHELDVIHPEGISWVGYLQCEKKIIEELQKKYICIGGYRRYGLGHVVLQDFQECKNYDEKPEKGVISTYKQDVALKNFVKFDNQNIEGKIELLATYNFEQNIPKVCLDKTSLYVSVGSIIKKIILF